MGDLTEISTPQTAAASSRPMPFREDCWSEEATSTLVDAWGRRYLELNRGNLRQKDWQEVADAVNARHGHNKKARRTDVQCKNRIDTLKKKYKTEKARVSDSNGVVTSSWPFYARLDSLIGSTTTQLAKKPAAPPPAPRSSSPPLALPLPYRKPMASPVVLPQKRPSPAVDDAYFRRNYSAVAAAAAAAATAEEEEYEDEDEDGSEDLGSSEGNDGQRSGDSEAMKRLARAIERFGEIYERVEREKQRHLIELEKQRMQFTEDLEVQRMELFMDTQLQLEKIKQSKRSGSNGETSVSSRLNYLEIFGGSFPI